MSAVMTPVADATQTVAWPAAVVTIDGIPTKPVSLDIRHGVDQTKGTASITLPLPLPDHLSARLNPNAGYNVPVEIKAGFAESGLMTRFVGAVQKKSLRFNVRDQSATFRADGQGRLLEWAEERDLWFDGPIALHDIARSLFSWRGMTAYRVDNIVDQHGRPIMMGGNKNIDDGRIKIPRRTPPIQWLDRKCQLFGYRAFEVPGEFRVQLVMGEPTAPADVSFVQGENVYAWSWDGDLDPMATYIRIDGATYTDDDGVQIPIISFTGAPPYEPLLNPPGYRPHTESDKDLVTNQLADAAREAQEINRGSPYSVGTIETYGHNLLNPGDVIHAKSEGVEVDGNYWVMSVREFITDSPTEYNTTLTAWASTGEAQPGGDDAEFITVRSAPVHLGDETIPWYAQPTPQGHEFPISVTVPDEYTSIAISLYAHGSNSYLIDGANTESTVSRIEVWQNGEEVGKAELPALPEDYHKQLPYSNPAHWTRVRMPVPGRLEAGPAEIKIMSGEDNRLPAHTKWDDFEVRDIVIELRGRVFPTLPTGGS